MNQCRQDNTRCRAVPGQHPLSGVACTLPQVEKPPVSVKEEPEVVRCFCGATSMDQAPEAFSGLWLQCDRCGRWQHGDCVGHPSTAPEGTPCQNALAEGVTGCLHCCYRRPLKVLLALAERPGLLARF